MACLIKANDKTWIKICTDPILVDILQTDVERLLISCGFELRTRQGGSHRRYKLAGTPNAFITLSGHGKRAKLPFYQVAQVRELILRLNLVEE